MSRAQTLLDLQAIDLTLDRLNKRLTDVKAGQRETEELLAARRAGQEAEQAAARDRAAHKDLELEGAAMDGRIKQAEQRLYSGLVKNPKELIDLQNDIASLKRQKAALDDRLLEAMVGLEESEATLQRRAAERARIETHWKNSQAELSAERVQLEAELAQQSSQLTGVRALLSAADLALYDQLRRRRGGLAVAELEEGACSGCGVEPTGNVLNQLGQGDQLARCGNCERILVRS